MADENINAVVENESAGVETAGAEATVAAETKPMTFDEFLKAAGNQAEFDRRINKAIETARGKFTDPKVTELQEQLNGYIRRECAERAGVSDAFRDFVVWETVKTMSDKDNFDDALKNYLEKHPQYIASASAQAAPNNNNGWGKPQTGNNEQQMSGVEAAFRKMNPKLKYD